MFGKSTVEPTTHGSTRAEKAWFFCASTRWEGSWANVDSIDAGSDAIETTASETRPRRGSERSASEEARPGYAFIAYSVVRPDAGTCTTPLITPASAPRGRA